MQGGRWRRGTRAGAVITVAVSAVAALGVALVPSARATQNVSTMRFGGGDRYETARLLAEHAFPGGATAVLLARAQDFPDGAKGFADALAGNYLAGYFNSPILLTAADTVPTSTLAALRDLKTKNVGILGGVGAVSQAVADQLAATASTSSAGGNLVIGRVAGGDRYQTAQMIAEIPPTTYIKPVNGMRTALVARGDNFPDALAGGPLADAAALPLILTTTDSLNPSAQKALQDLGIQQVLILGGGSAVSPATEAQINALGIKSQRLDGANRQQTAAAIADFAIANLGFKATLADLARGDDYPDALAGGPEAAKAGPVVIVLTGSPTELSADTRAWIRSHDSTLSEIDAFGLQAAVSDSVLADAAGTATCAPSGSGTSLPVTLPVTLPGGGTTMPGGGGTSTTGASTSSSVPPCSTPPTTAGSTTTGGLPTTLPGGGTTTTAPAGGTTTTTSAGGTTTTTVCVMGVCV